ncbi:MAG: hypothetical protein ACE5R3_05440 [Nitrosopumilaceae archaeon]
MHREKLLDFLNKNNYVLTASHQDDDCCIFLEVDGKEIWIGYVFGGSGD